MRKLVAKFHCYRVEEANGEEEVYLSAVTSGGPDDPNREWSEATPAGNFDMLISNPRARGVIKQGQDVLITLEPVVPDEESAG